MATLPVSYCLILLALVQPLPGTTVQGRPEFASARIEVEAPAEQPAAVPILLTLKVTNTGDGTINYRVDQDGVRYPSASWFKALITDSNGKLVEVKMSNDSQVDLVGSHIISRESILPGQSVKFPAVMPPLPTGAYSIQVLNGKTAKVTIKDDKELTRKWTQEILAKIRKEDSFAKYAASKYPTRALTETFLHDLSSDDFPASDRAAEILGRFQSLPSNSLGYIKDAIHKQLALARQGLVRTGNLSGLTYFASKIGTDEALKLVLEVARTDKVRGDAVGALEGFKQEAAVKELHRFLNDPDQEIQSRAAYFLAKRNEKAALEVLLTLVNDSKVRWRKYAIEQLVKFAKDPRVEPAIKDGLNDPDWRVKQAAEYALRDLVQEKKKKP